MSSFGFLTRMLLTILLTFATLAAHASTGITEDEIAAANSKLEQAHVLFQRGENAQAMEIYESLGTRLATADVWANAGTAAWRANEKGRAVLYYLRSLRLDPTNERAAASLAVASPSTNKSDGDLFPMLARALRAIGPSGFWMGVGLLAFLTASLLLALFLGNTDANRRSTFGATAAWLFAFAFILYGAGWITWKDTMPGNYGVVLADKTIIRSEPKTDGMAQLEVPAGTIVVTTEDPQSGFVRVRLLDGRGGFLRTTELEKI